MPFFHSRAPSGFSLIELLLVLAIIAGLATAAFIIYPRVQAGRQAGSEKQTLAAAQAGVKVLYKSGDFSALTPTVANQADFFPPSMQDTSTTLVNQFGGAVDVTGSTNVGAVDAAAPAQFFRFSYSGIPTEVCVKLAAATAQNFGAVYIGSAAPGTAIKNDFTGVALNESIIPTQCASAATVVMIFVSN